jgi:hypothetical protein
MSPPHCDWPLGSNTPYDYPPICITSHKSCILADESGRVDLRTVASEDVCWLGGRQSHPPARELPSYQLKYGRCRSIRVKDSAGNAVMLLGKVGVDVDNRQHFD